MNLRWLAWGLVAVVAVTFGCASTRPHAGLHVSASVDPDSLPAPAMYAELCSQCHGPDAKGYAADHAPSLVNPTFLESVTDDFLHRSIGQGRPGTAMAAYDRSVGGPLGSEAIDRVLFWLRSKGPAEKDLPRFTPGDPDHGRPLYEANCLRCHGDATRHGDAVMIANPGFLVVASDAFVRHAIMEGRPGTPMPSFRAKLDTTQVADIVSYVRSLATSLDAARLPGPTGQEPLFGYPDGRTPEFQLKDNRYVGVDDVNRALQQHRKLVIIDARPASEWRSTHITTAVSIPHYKVDRIDEIPVDATVVAYCACPHHLSGAVVDSLRAHGRMHSYVLDEGVLEWERRGYPIVAAPGTSLPPAEMKNAGR
jgi:mono/diheme cytochrome c family protein/rhodanese-related sulfurtransferase